MTVEELLEDLRAMPSTARVVVRIRENVNCDGVGLDELYEFREADPDAVLYDLGEVVVQLAE